jgi:UDP-glucuronate decarboxylase
MLGLAKRTKSRFFQASTSEVYGDPEIHPQREDYWGHVNPLGPRACYDEGKRCAESLCMSYHQQHGMTLRMARIFNTYGPRMHPNDGRVVSNFIVAAIKNAPIEIYGDGSQTRSFCYVDDMIEGFIALMALETFEGPVNLGRPHEVTVRQLAEQVIALTGSRSKIEHKPSPADDPLRRLPDIALARRLLNWEPKTGLDEGLAKTIAYFEGILSEQ